MTQNERDPVIERLFDGLEPPNPPAGLRRQVLEAARSTHADPALIDSWTRVWTHRGLRMAWAASIAFLLVSHLIVGFGGPQPVATTAEIRIDQTAVEFLRQVEISDTVRPIVGLFAAGEDPAGLESRGESS